MFLVVTGNFDPEEIIGIVKENQEKRSLINAIRLLSKVKESDDVHKEYEEIKMNVEVPKISYGIKIPLKNIKIDPKKRHISFNYIQ